LQDQHRLLGQAVERERGVGKTRLRAVQADAQADQFFRRRGLARGAA
jgi:hypothetical protein